MKTDKWFYELFLSQPGMLAELMPGIEKNWEFIYNDGFTPLIILGLLLLTISIILAFENQKQKELYCFTYNDL